MDSYNRLLQWTIVKPVVNQTVDLGRSMIVSLYFFHRTVQIKKYQFNPFLVGNQK